MIKRSKDVVPVGCYLALSWTIPLPGTMFCVWSDGSLPQKERETKMEKVDKESQFELAGLRS